MASSFIETIWRNTMHISTNINRHSRVSLAYALIFGGFTAILVPILAKPLAEEGAIFAMLIVQLLMTVAVIRITLPAIGENSFIAWLVAILKPPLYILSFAFPKKTLK